MPIGAKCGYLGGPGPPGLEPVGPWCWAMEQWSKLWYGRTLHKLIHRLQLNPKIMLIESKYLSQLHFSTTDSPRFSFP